MKKVQRNKLLWVAAILSLLVGYALSPLAIYGIPKKYWENTSPSGKYRLDFYKPRYCPYAYFAYRDAFFIKLYNIEQQRYVYTSNLDEGLARHPTTWLEEGSGYISPSYGIRVNVKQLE